MFQGDSTVISIFGGDLFHQRRLLKDGQLLFLANSSLKESSHVRVHMAGKKVLLMNTFTGKITGYAGWEEGGKLGFECEIPPAGSMLFFVGNEGAVHDRIANEVPVKSTSVKETVLVTEKATVVRPRTNTLMIDFCDVRIGILC
jgi:hypothetical protein